MKKLLDEFKEFINRGNVMDLAVGVIIGGAFTAIVTSLTTDIINPLITVIAGGGADSISGLVVPGTDIDFGKFLSAVINFLIVALVVFFLVKGLNKLQNAGTKVLHHGKDGEAEVEMLPPTCPFCLEEVKEGATRCPHCAGELPKPAAPTPKE
ncbi:MAG: large conductance mechanosensitive channel protein MscL [Eggerthellaceae bacterium]|nr:large conductance mechanosensitive channel protein MscL [Eggerthellaceae bacterium]